MNRAIETGFPCWRCEVRADVDCKHRPGIAPREPDPVEKLASGRKPLGTGARWYEKRDAA